MPIISTQFKQIFTAAQLENEVEAVLRVWFPTYLREMERQLDLQPNSVKEPVTYTNRNTFTALPGEELPKCLIVSPGINPPPHKRGGGSYDVDWRIAVGVAFAMAQEEDSNNIVKAYAGAIRACVLQQLGRYVTWLDENYDDIPLQDRLLQYKAAAVYFTIMVNNVVSLKGPEIPDNPPDQYDYGQAQVVIVDKDKLPIT